MIIKRSIDFIIRLSNISCWYYIVALAIGLIVWLKWGKLSIAILTTYCLIIFSAVVLSRKSGREVTNITLFKSYKKGITPQILANILIFIPIGVIIARINWKLLWFGLFFSLFIEASQLITHRGWFDVDDIISNSIGVLIGVAIYIVIAKMIQLFKPEIRTFS